MRKLILCLIVLNSFPAFAKTIILNGTLPEGATIVLSEFMKRKEKSHVVGGGNIGASVVPVNQSVRNV